ncbi:MAG: HAD family hydrolase [Acidobacteria bacterium]|nr:MAG: HAD family hydrolase [Acidobacteriota bacterium]REK11828.1 MAG: HAD family hydrolase [Acidobacteriota bacterium]
MCADSANLRARPYELIVFDWDGTLRDSVGSIVGCARTAIEELGLETDDEAIRATVGTGLQQAVPRWVPGIDPGLIEAVIDGYRRHWIADWNDRADFFPGVIELIQRLSDDGYLLSVATGKGRRGLGVDMQRSGVSHLFAATRTSDDCAAKPAPQMVLEILGELGVRADAALVVGDTTHDLEMARAAGVDAVGTGRGAMAPEVLAPLALTVLGCATELPEWLATVRW